MSGPREPANHTDHRGKPWGVWSTLGLGFLIVALWMVVQAIAARLLAGRGVRAQDATARGWIVAWVAIMSAPLVVGASVLLARVRKGISVAAYLALEWPRAQEVRRWSLAILGLIAASDSLSLAMGRSVVPEPMVRMYRTAGALPIFLIGVVIAAPLAEEFLFRGFLFAGLLSSRLGPSGAIVLTALAWGCLHGQYDLYGMATVAVTGILLGLVRWRTGSLWLCVVLHGLMNIVATVELMLVASRR